MNTVSLAIIKLVIIAFFGFIIYKKKVVDEAGMRFLISLVINFTIPCLFFSHLVRHSSLVREHSLWRYLAMSALIFSLGVIFSLLLRRGSARGQRKEIMGLLSFQNAGYLPMNIVFFLFAGQMREQFLVYIFLYLLGFNILIWSFGSFFIFQKEKKKLKLKTFFTPPITSTLVALLFVYLGWAPFLPDIILQPLGMVGDLSFVLSMIILGCWLARVNHKDFKRHLPLLIQTGFLKLIVIPLTMICLLVVLGQTSVLGFFLLLQSVMPSAVTLPIVAEMHDADSSFISQGVFLTHLLSIVTIPLWLGLWASAGFFTAGG